MLSGFGFSEWMLTFCLVILSILGLRILLETNDERSYKRLQSLIKTTDKEEERKVKEEESFFVRLYKAAERAVSRYVDTQIRKGNLSSMELKIQQAGSNTTTNKIWTQTLIYGFIGSVIGLLTKEIALVLAFSAVGAYLPYYRLKEQIKKRQFELIRHLPDFLDLVAITYPATNNIEETFKFVCEKYDNLISYEFQIVLNEINLGRNKRVVYNELALRTGIEQISQLISQINQSQTFGSPMEDVLLTQARSIRHAKKTAVENQGRKAKNLIYAPGAILLIASLGVILFPFIVPIMQSFQGGVM